MTTPSCLLYAGALGHLWAVTRGSVNDPSGERTGCECSYGADAVRYFDELPLAQRGSIYERVPRGRRGQRHNGYRWARRSRAYALLDQPPGRPYEPAIAEGGAP